MIGRENLAAQTEGGGWNNRHKPVYELIPAVNNGVGTAHVVRLDLEVEDLE